jgi:autotransporter-associated beta strand protein
MTSKQANDQRCRTKRAAALFVAAGATVAAMAPSAHGISATWLGSTNGSWATATNWNAAVPGTGDTAIFNNAGNNNTTIDLGAGVSVNTILFDTNAAGYTIGAGAVNSQALTLDNTGSVTINATVIKDQQFNANITLGTAATGSDIFTNNAPLNVDYIAGNITGGTGGIAGVKSISFAGAGTNNVSGNITPGGATSLVLVKSGAGMLVLSGNNNIGSVNLSSGFSDIVRLASNGALGTAPITLTGTTSTMELTNGITMPNAITYTAGRGATVILRNLSGNNTYSGTVNFNVNSGQAAFESYNGLFSLSGTIGGTATTRQLVFFGAGDGLFTPTSTIGTAFTQLRKDGPGVLTLAGLGTLTGNAGIPINGGTLKFDDTTGNYHTNAATPIAFANAGGTLNVVSAAAGSTQSFGSLSFTGGEAVLQSTYGTTGTATIGFFQMLARGSGTDVNFVTTGGTPSTPGSSGTNFFKVTTTPSISTTVDPGIFYNGSSYAFYDVGGFVRGLSYGTDPNSSTTGTTSSVSGTNVQVTGPVTAQSTTSLNTLNIVGANNFTFQDSGQILNVNGILKTGGGASDFSNGAGIQQSTGDLVIRTDGPTDSVTLDVPIGTNGGNTLTKSGKGTLSLTQSNFYTGLTSVLGGTLNNSGVINTNATASTGAMLINNAVVNNSGQIFAGAAALGNAAIAVGNQSVSALNITGGQVTVSSGATQRDIQMGINAGGYGVLNLSGGNVSDTGFLVAGFNANGAIGIVNITGGNYTVSGNFGGTIGTTLNANGVLNITSGSYSDTDATASGAAGIYIGESGNGVMNVSGTGIATLGGASTSNGLNIGRNSAATVSGIVNLGAVGVGGGMISTVRVQKTGALATGVFNFHGGTLQVGNNANTTFMTGLTSAYVYNEGAIIDTNNQSVTIAQPLLAPTGIGVTSITGVTGSGYIGTPLVQISGGKGYGATAVANVDANGNLTGITITNPGVYTVAPTTVTISGGRGTTAGSAVIGTGANSGGGLTKLNGGTLTLTGANNYTGNTSVQGGALILNGQTLSSTGGVSVTNGSTLGLNTVTLNTTGQLNVNGGGTLSLKDNAINTDTVGNISLSGANLNFELSSTSADKITGTLAATDGGGNNINISLISAQGLANGAYTLIHDAAGGVASTDFSIASAPAGFSNFSLSSPGGTDLILNVSGNATPATAYWTGRAGTNGGNNTWGSNPGNGTSNWATNVAGTTDAKQVPGGSSDVIFTATNATGGPSLTTQLDNSYSIKSLTFDVPVATGITSATVDTNGNNLVLGAGGLVLASTSNSTGTLSGSGSISLNGSQNWNNNSNTQSLNVTAPVSALGGVTTLTIGGTGNGGVNIGGVIGNGAGTVSLVVSNSNVVLTANNTYNGTTTVNSGGALTVNNSSGGRISSETTVSAGGTLILNGGSDAFNDANTVTLAGVMDVRDIAGTDKTETTGALNGTGTVTRSTLGTTTLTIGSASNLSSTFSGIIQNGVGTVAVTTAGTGTATFSSANTYTGNTTVTGGVLVANDGVGIPTASNLTLNGGVVAATGSISRTIGTGAGQIQLPGGGSGFVANGANLAVTIANGGSPIQWGSSTFNPGTLEVNATGAGTLTVAADLDLNNAARTITDGGGTVTFTGAISDSGTTGSLQLTGTGLIVMPHSNTYPGATLISINGQQGATANVNVLATANNALGLGTVSINSTGNSSTNTLELSGGITLPNYIQLWARSVGNTAPQIESLSGNNTLSNQLTLGVGGAMYLIKSDAGTLTLSGANNTLNPGVAILGGASDTGSPGGNRIVTLTGAGNGVVSGTIVNGTATLSLSKNGPGYWLLTGANTYNGITTVQNGTLELGVNAQSPVLTASPGGADVQGGRLIFDYSGASIGPSINSMLATSYNSAGGFTNTANRLISTTATGTLGLGMTDDGVSKVTVGYTVFGDANLDGKVNALDFNALATNFGKSSGALWYQGDFNYSGAVDTADFMVLSQNFGLVAPIPTAAPSLGAPVLGTLVPEPASMGLILLTAGMGMSRRRRRADK